MGRHVAPHRWADAAANRVAQGPLRAMQAHAESCERCARVRDRVAGVQRGFAEIRQSEPPRLDWEHIGARIYWVTSSERRAASRSEPYGQRRKGWFSWYYGGGVLAAGAAAGLLLLALWPSANSADPSTSSGTALPATAASSTADPSPAGDSIPLEVELIADPAEALQGVVTYLEGDVLVGGAALGIDRILARGDVLTTGDKGRVTVQFGHASGFTLAPRSTLELRALDEAKVSLVLSGDVTVDIERRPAGQAFEVVAGEHVVEVRGTAFSVAARRGALAVACARGKVALRGLHAAGPALEVSAGQLFELGAGQSMQMRRPLELSAEAAVVLEREVGVRLLPVWSGAESLRQTSSTLRLAARGNRRIVVDGEEIGRGQLQVRVMPGRHLVDAGSGATWVRASGGESVQPELTARPKIASKSKTRVRRAHLDRALARGDRARRCMRSLEKQGLLEGSFVELDLGVNADGSLGHLNIRRTNVSARAASCVRSVVDSIRLPAGPRTTLRYRIGF